jgi:flagellar motor switch protein FliM
MPPWSRSASCCCSSSWARNSAAIRSCWETHLAEELWNTEVELDVVLDEQTMRLSDVMALQPGTRVVLNTMLGAPVLVRCGAVVLFEGRVGRRKNRIAVRIERDIPRLQQTER